MKPILPQLVVFDVAGTTVRDEGGAVNRCLREALIRAGVSVTPKQVNAVMGIAKPLAIQHLMVSPSAERVADVYRDFVGRMQDYYRTSDQVGEIEGASLIFHHLREAGIKVALGTGFAREIITVLIERLGWQESVDAIICSDEVPRGRPHPDMIHALMQRFDITDPQRVAKVGDTPFDLMEGVNAGCGWNIGVTYGSHTEKELISFPHTNFISRISSLNTIFS